MSEEINEMPGESVMMDSTEFEAKLTAFFTKHKESKLKLVPRIVEEFRGYEGIVLEHLHNKYVLGLVSEKPKKKHAAKSEGHTPDAAENTTAEAKPKSKKKLFIIIGIAVVVIGLGAAGFLMKDKFLGKSGEPAKTEAAPAETTPAAEQPKQEQEASPAASATDSVPTASSASDSASAPADSAATQE
jgi:hypothetical protein